MSPADPIEREPRFRPALLGAVVGLAVLACTSSPAADRARHVDPFIGTGGHGHTYPGATLPFGMVQLGPDTRLEGWDGCSGYHDSDSVIYGFSHTHLSGTGISDYGDILLMPMTGDAKLDNGHDRGPDTGYASRFDKATERAEPGSYAVRLADYGIDVELTVTERAGFHRYRFPARASAHVIVDLEHRDTLLDSSLRVVNDREIEGCRRSTGWARDQRIYFVARFSRPFLPTLAEQGRAKMALAFGKPGGELTVQVGLSAVDIDGARRNLDGELAGRCFDRVRQAARRRWRAALGRIEVSGGIRRQKTLFYTALYHSLLAPNVYSDVDGRYRGMDGAIHVAQGRRQYTVFSLWDTFRATHPLFTLIERERTAEFIETFLAQYQQGGRLPVWELAANETDTMIGYHAVSVIADAWAKGIRGFDATLALEAMVHSANLEHFGLEAYKRQGFVGAEDEAESVSKTLEYAYDDWCIARMAADLGRDEVAGVFFRRSQGWRHLLDPETRFMRPRRHQRWLDPFDPRRVDNHFTEANAWQYSLFVPHDVEGLIDAYGGDARFAGRLDALFEADSQTTGRDQPDITGLIGQYAHGNEPSHHMAWLYHFVGRPAESTRRVHEILTTLYSVEPDGLSGNEDCGQMSSWYVLSALGLYSVAPGSPDWVLGTPLFDRVVLHLENGRRFTLQRKGDGRYIQSARLNSRDLGRSFLRHDELMAGGQLVLDVGATPSEHWGVAPAERPRSFVAAQRVLAAPFVSSGEETFAESVRVVLGHAEPAATIRYSVVTEGRETEWTDYRAPLIFEQSTRLRLQAEREGFSSPVVETFFHRLPNAWGIEVATPPRPQYTAGGPRALIDGLRGARDWRTGGWQGYQGADFEATVDLGHVRPLPRAGGSFLQDVRSWIWMPVEVVVAVSVDGVDYHEVARVGHGVSDAAYGIIRGEIAADLENVRARFVKIRAVNYGAIPTWHPGRGHPAFIFIDELLID